MNYIKKFMEDNNLEIGEWFNIIRHGEMKSSEINYCFNQYYNLKDLKNDDLVPELCEAILSGDYKIKKIKKPPLGLKPKRIHDLERSVEIREAIERYSKFGKEIPEEWIKEYCELFDADNSVIIRLKLYNV